MKGQLWIRAAARLFSGMLIMGTLLFLPAGTVFWWQAWLLLASLFVPMVVAGTVMLWKAPALLEKRLGYKEEQDAQKAVLSLSALMFAAAFVIAGLHRRFGWPMLPGTFSWVAAVVFWVGYGLYAEVLRENAFLSRTVEVQAGQKVIDTGLYGIVRHPMYMSTLLIFLSMPLILGVLPSFFIMLAYLPIIRIRILNEENLLERELEGYLAYKQRVKYRLIPFIW